MSLLDIAIQIFDLDVGRAMQEVEKKLTYTWCIINDKVLYVEKFHFNENIIIVSDGVSGVSKPINVKTFETFLPKAGLYRLPDGELLYVRKCPKRQWNRSMSSNYYSLVTPEGHPINFTSPRLTALRNATKCSIGVNKEGKIYFNCLIIGFVDYKKNKIVCTNKTYLQELQDWNKSCV